LKSIDKLYFFYTFKALSAVTAFMISYPPGFIFLIRLCRIYRAVAAVTPGAFYNPPVNNSLPVEMDIPGRRVLRPLLPLVGLPLLPLVMPIIYRRNVIEKPHNL